MTDFSWLSTKTEKVCRHCGEDLVLVDPTDVLAARPIEVELLCPSCSKPTTALLTMEQMFRSIYPQLLQVEPELDASNDNGSWSQFPPRGSEFPPPSELLH